MIPTLKAKPRKDHYGAATLHINDASSFCHISCHESTTVSEALDAKHLFETEAAKYGVKPKHYHGDNGVFACNSHKADCIGQQQTYHFSAPNFHPQNGVAECYIRTFTERARAMLLDAMRLWPDIVSQDLWPFALKLAGDGPDYKSCYTQ